MERYVEKEVKRVDVWQLKKYVCKVKIIDIYTGRNIIVLNTEEAKEHDIYAGYRTKFEMKNKTVNVRTRDEKVHGEKKVDILIKNLLKEVEERK